MKFRRLPPLLAVLLLALPARASEAAGRSEATLVGVRGTVLLDGASARPATPLRTGQVVATGPTSEATLLLPDGSIFTVRGATRLRLSRLLLEGGARDVRVDLEGGGLLSEIAPSRWTSGTFEVGTPVAVAGVRGTSFHSDFNGSEATFDVFAGKIEVMSPTGAFRPTEIGAGQRIRATGAGRTSRGAARSGRAPTQNRPALASEGSLPHLGGPGGQQGRGGPGGVNVGSGPSGPMGQGSPGPGGPGGVRPGGPGGGPSPGGMMQPRPGGVPEGRMAPMHPMHIGPNRMPPPQLGVPLLAQPPPSL